MSACQRGAPLDVQLALLKVTARPGLSRFEVIDRVLIENGGYFCGSCGSFHFDDGEQAAYAHDQAAAAWERFLRQNEVGGWVGGRVGLRGARSGGVGQAAACAPTLLCPVVPAAGLQRAQPAGVAGRQSAQATSLPCLTHCLPDCLLLPPLLRCCRCCCRLRVPRHDS